jgi:hypothetical protein
MWHLILAVMWLGTQLMLLCIVTALSQIRDELRARSAPAGKEK